jgi:hypothetical protein
MTRLAQRVVLVLLSGALSGCVVASVASTAVNVVGTAASTTVSVAGTAVGATADVVGGAVGLVVPDGDDAEED